METVSKKHIIAERYIETGVADSLSNLFVCDYADFKVLSLYSDLSKRLLAYKILHQSEEANDSWFDAEFNKTVRVDFNPNYTLVPSQFSTVINLNDSEFGFHIEGNHIASNHFVHGIAKYNALRFESIKVYLFKSVSILNVLIFKDKTCLFSNAFPCHNETEILYFVLAALEASDCTQEHANVFLDFDLGLNESLSTFLMPYFKSISTLKFEGDGLDEEILNLPELLFVNYAMSLCG
jgi:hypothetical protein